MHLNGHGVCHLSELTIRGPTLLFELPQYRHGSGPPPRALHSMANHQRRRCTNRRSANHRRTHCQFPHLTTTKPRSVSLGNKFPETHPKKSHNSFSYPLFKKNEKSRWVLNLAFDRKLQKKLEKKIKKLVRDSFSMHVFAEEVPRKREPKYEVKEDNDYITNPIKRNNSFSFLFFLFIFFLTEYSISEGYEWKNWMVLERICWKNKPYFG